MFLELTKMPVTYKQTPPSNEINILFLSNANSLRKKVIWQKKNNLLHWNLFELFQLTIALVVWFVRAVSSKLNFFLT